MALTKPDREFIQILIQGVNGRIDAVETLLESKINETIELQKKTNGTVRKHDEQISEALIERAKNRQQQKDSNEKLTEVVKIVEKIKEIESSHYTTCPQTSKVRKLEDEVIKQQAILESKTSSTGRFLQVVGIVVMFSGVLASVILGVANYKKNSEVQFPTIDETTRFRGLPLDPVYYNDSLNPAPKYELK